MAQVTGYICGLKRFARPLFLVFLSILASSSVATASGQARICDVAAKYAAQATGVPLSVLRAISLTETGRRKAGKMQPWPWTVNMQGTGVWFDDADSAKAYVYKHYKRGARSFDVGCFQINYKWHGHAFDSIEQMFEPRPNALYAANFLTELFRETGDWSKAAGAYHSRTQEHANRYRKRFDQFRARLAGADQSIAPDRTDVSRPILTAASHAPPPAIRVNRYPLLQSGRSTGGLGSLVPQTNQPATGLFARRKHGG